LAEALRGETLDVIGVKTGRITEVFGFEPVKSGKYEPIVIDFTLRDGHKRLAEIRVAIENGSYENWLELVFLPLFGKETGSKRSAMVEEVLRFESKLYHSGKIPVRLLVSTLILSNKLIGKERLKALWEEIKMLDIFDIAIEEGIQKGKTLGFKEGKTLGVKVKEGGMETAREMVLETLIQRFSIVSAQISEQIRKIQNQDILKQLHRQAVICKDLHKFESVLKQLI